MSSYRRKQLFLKALVELRVHGSLLYFLRGLKDSVQWFGPGQARPTVQRPCFFIGGAPKSGKTCLANRILQLWPDAKVIEEIGHPSQRALGCDMIIVLEHTSRCRSSARILKSRWHHCDPLHKFWIDLAS